MTDLVTAFATQNVPLPDGFTPVGDALASPDFNVNVIGVVVDYLPPKESRGPDWCLTVGLQDRTGLTSYGAGAGLRVRFFAPQKLLPKVMGRGDVIIVWGLRLSLRLRDMLISQQHVTRTIVLPANSISDPAFGAIVFGDHNIKQLATPGSLTNKASPHELLYVMHLRKWALNEPFLSLPGGAQNRSPHGFPSPSGLSPTPMPHSSPYVSRGIIPTGPANSMASGYAQRTPTRPANGRQFEPASRIPTGPAHMTNPIPQSNFRGKLSLLKDVKDRGFYDIVAEVRKLWYDEHATDLYVTDYTTNSLFYDYPRKPAQQLPEGMDGDTFNYLQKPQSHDWPGPFGKMAMQVRLWPPHNSVTYDLKVGSLILLKNVNVRFRNGQLLEGAIHTDRTFPQKVEVQMENAHDSAFHELRQRRDTYCAQETARGSEAQKPAMSKQEKKKRKREAAKRQKLAAELAGGGDAMFDPKVNNTTNGKAEPKTNSNDILCTPNLKYRDSSREEITLPFVNMKTRVRVRVIDFYPSNLRDFTQCLDHQSYNDCESHPRDPSPEDFDDSSLLPTRWEWSFYLLIEDAKTTPGEKPDRMPLLVAGKDAEYLLKLDAVDLRHDEKTLSALREKLFILWGNLEDLKAEGRLTGTTPSNVPFECCISEYGVEQESEWTRVHRLFMTTIR